MKEHVALSGFMAARKSIIGRHLAREPELPFVDTDTPIVERHGPIHEMFTREGYEAFRRYEFEAVRDVLAGPRARTRNRRTRALAFSKRVRLSREKRRR